MNLCEQIFQLVLESMRDEIQKKFKIDEFEKADPSHKVCSIGYSTPNKKYYGWSHRAIHGFGVGDKLFDEKWDDNGKLSPEEIEKMKFSERGSETIKTKEQARQAACNFARYVS